MVLWNVSEQDIQFRVSVPVDTTPGIYSLTWSKSGDDYDKAKVGDEIYAPVIPSVVVVTDEITKIQITETSEVV